MKNIAIIPARGGSKRIPGKNIKDFLGKPIIAYSIEAAINSRLFDEVMVSTEDNEIAEIAEKYNAKVPFLRSEENSNDYATTMDAIKEVISQYKEKFNIVFENVCCIYPTAPLIQVGKLKEGLALLNEKGYDSVFPVVKFSYPVWRGLKIFSEGETQMLWPEYLKSRSQDLPNVYHDAGQWYWMKIKKIIDSVFTQNSGSIILSEEEVQDIDNLSDWKLVEMKYKLLNEA